MPHRTAPPAPPEAGAAEIPVAPLLPVIPGPSNRAKFLVEQCIFWLASARAGSLNAGSVSFWESRCRHIAAELIGAGA